MAWSIPLPGESIGDYALRMKRDIPEEDPILMGVSFGGMMAVEIAKHFPAATVILISSVGTRRQLPWWMKVVGWLGLNRLLPKRPGKGLRWLENYYLGVESEDDARLVDAFRGRVDPRYLRWAVKEIVNWQNEWLPDRFFHLHGDRDRIFPSPGAAYIVRGAGHFMVYNRAEEVSGLLTSMISSL